MEQELIPAAVTNDDLKEYIQAVTQSMERLSQVIIQQNERIKLLESHLNTLERVVGNVALK